jgi:hypothetical protein
MILFFALANCLYGSAIGSLLATTMLIETVRLEGNTIDQATWAEYGG